MGTRGLGVGWRLVVAALLLVPVERAGPRLQVVVLLALVAAVAALGGALAKRLLGDVAVRDRRFAAAVMGIATCVVAGDVIGHFGVLTGSWFRAVLAALVLASALAFGVGGEWLARRRARPGAPRHSPPSSIRAAFQLRAPSRWRRWQRAVLWACALLVLVAFLRTAQRYRHVAPGHFSFDDTSYHLTAVGTWAMHGDLRMPRFTYGDPRTSFYPFASELLAWELTTPFAGGDFAARWVELPFALLTLMGIALVARRSGAGESALLAPLFYATVSEAWPAMALTAGNDHALAFAAVATVHGASLLRERPRVGAGLYAGAGLGLLLATKYLGVIYAPLLVVLVVLAVAVPRRDEAWRARAAALLAVAGSAAVVGGYAYLRNGVTTGNPLYPVSLHLGPWSLPGWVDVAPAAWSRVADAGFHPWRFPWQAGQMFGRLFRFTLLPASLVAPIAALWLAPRRRRVPLAWLFAMPLFIYVQFVLLVEDHRGVRYLLPGIAFAAVALAWLVSRLPPPWRGVVAVLLGAAAVAPWVEARSDTVLFVPVAAAGAWLLTRPSARRPSRSVAALTLATLGALALVVAAPGAMRKYEQHRFDNLRAGDALERLTGGEPARVAYAGWNQPYLFFGRRLRNAVYMPPVAPTLDAMFYRWRGPLEEPESTKPRRDWMRNLERLRVQWVVWVKAGGEVRPEHEWMARSRHFAPVYADRTVEIWQVRR